MRKGEAGNTNLGVKSLSMALKAKELPSKKASKKEKVVNEKGKEFPFEF